MSAGSIQGTGDAGKLIAAYERVADLTPEARERELETMRQNQPALAGRLERMLAREAEATSWLERLEQTLAGNLAAELDSAWATGRAEAGAARPGQRRDAGTLPPGARPARRAGSPEHRATSGCRGDRRRATVVRNGVHRRLSLSRLVPTRGGRTGCRRSPIP